MKIRLLKRLRQEAKDRCKIEYRSGRYRVLILGITRDGTMTECRMLAERYLKRERNQYVLDEIQRMKEEVINKELAKL